VGGVPENTPNSLGESTFTLLNPKSERKTQLGSFFCDRFYGAVSVRKVFQRSRPKSTSPHSKRVVGVSAEKKSRTPVAPTDQSPFGHPVGGEGSLLLALQRPHPLPLWAIEG
jgi:hypothetical protein